MTMNDDTEFSNDAADASASDAASSDVIVEELTEEIDVIVDEAGDIEVIDTEIEVDVIDTDELLERQVSQMQTLLDRQVDGMLLISQHSRSETIRAQLAGDAALGRHCVVAQPDGRHAPVAEQGFGSFAAVGEEFVNFADLAPRSIAN